MLRFFVIIQKHAYACTSLGQEMRYQFDVIDL